MDIEKIAESIQSEEESVFSGRIKQAEFFSDEDESLCDRCGKLDGKIFDIVSCDLPLLPLHPHCRCKYIVPGDPGRDISRAVEKYRIYRNLIKHKNMAPALARELAGEVIRARKENKKIKETDLFLLFNGRYFLSSDGKFIVDAVAGQPVDIQKNFFGVTHGGFVESGKRTYFDYSKSRQEKENEGGLPEGLYHVATEESGSLFSGNWGKHWDSPWSWGKYHWQLVPDKETDMRGRKPNSFTIHGGWFPQSAGCIDLTSHDGEFYDYMRSLDRKNIDVYVQYAREIAVLEEIDSKFLSPIYISY